MKTYLGLILCTWWVGVEAVEVSPSRPRPRLRLDPGTRATVVEAAA
jgi:hypothetical protein